MPRRVGPALAALALLGGAAAADAREVAPHNSVVHRGGHPIVVSTHGDPLTFAGRGHGGGAFAAPIGPTVIQPALATAWCGNERSSDYTTSSLGSAPAIKVIYAYPTDRHHFDTYQDFIQGEVKAAADRVAGSPGATKTLRFDLGTDCNAPNTNPLDYVDIESVALADTAGTYAAMAPSTRFTMIENEVKAAVGPQGGLRNFVVFADGVGGADAVAGIGERVTDDSADPGNAANTGGWYAMVFGLATATGDFFNGNEPYAGAYILHEITHTLGAVQVSAPHTTGAGHCTDEYDVMCYADGGPNNNITFSCNTINSLSNEAYDCNEDDYFSPSPSAGSYLATHWNAQNSVFMCPLARCQTADSPPAASLSPSHAHVGSPVSLNAAGSTDDTSIANFAWDLDGDGHYETSTGTTPTLVHTFSSIGFKHLAVTDTDGAVSTANLRVYPPLVTGGSAPASAVVGQTVSFSSAGSFDPDGESIASYGWDFDGNGTVDSTAPNPATSYSAPGTYHATLTVSDSVGATATGSATVTVSAASGGGSGTGTSSGCVVPKLKGKKLSAAKKSLSKARCKLGKVTKKKAAKSARGRVVGQKPGAGKHLARGAKVAVTIGK